MKKYLVLLILFAFQTIHAQIPSVRDFIADPLVMPGSVKLSPTGQYFGMVVPRGNRSDLVIVDVKTRAALTSVKPPSGEHVASYWWVSDKRVVAAFAKRSTDKFQPALTGELWAVDADGSNSRYLFGFRAAERKDSKANRSNRATAFVISPRLDAQNTILIGIRELATKTSESTRLARLNVDTGTISPLKNELPVKHGAQILVDADGVAQFCAGQNDQEQRFLYQRVDDSTWRLLNDVSKSKQEIIPVAFTPSGKVWARVAENDGAAYLAEYDPASGSIIPKVTTRYASIGGLQFGPDEATPFAVRTNEGKGGYVMLAPQSAEAKLVTEAMKQFPGELVIASGFSRDGRLAVLAVSGDRNPGAYYLVDRQSNQVSTLIKVKPDLQSNQLAAMEVVDIPTRDHLTLRGYLTKSDTSNSKLPLIVLPHGGPIGVADRWGFDHEAQLFASRGYAVLQVNYRGSGGYGRKFEDMGQREWGGKMQDDLTDATRWAIEQGHADKDRICIVGASYGAYAALMGAAKEPDLYQCAVGMYGVYDLSLMTRIGDIEESVFGRHYLKRQLDQDEKWLNARSPVAQAEKIKAKVLLIHGGADRRTPPEHAARMRKALQKAGNAPEWMFEKNEGHGFYDDANRLAAYETILGFLAPILSNAKNDAAH